jgi:hypothetical protein
VYYLACGLYKEGIGFNFQLENILYYAAFKSAAWLKQLCHLTILSFATVCSVQTAAHHHLVSRISKRGAMFILATYAFTASNLSIFSILLFHEGSCGVCYFCFLMLNSYVDQTTVLLLQFSVYEQVSGSNHCPITSVLCL